MVMKSLILSAVALGLTVGAWTPALAQSDPDAHRGEGYTTENLDPADPCGDMEVDMTRAPNAGEVTDEQMADIRARCETILANRDTYGPAASGYCEEQHNTPTR